MIIGAVLFRQESSAPIVAVSQSECQFGSNTLNATKSYLHTKFHLIPSMSALTVLTD
jgi:hypothetical protein